MNLLQVLYNFFSTGMTSVDSAFDLETLWIENQNTNKKKQDIKYTFDVLSSGVQQSSYPREIIEMDGGSDKRGSENITSESVRFSGYGPGVRQKIIAFSSWLNSRIAESLGGNLGMRIMSIDGVETTTVSRQGGTYDEGASITFRFLFYWKILYEIEDYPLEEVEL